ncbi:unnamed protein product, partial [Mesorhabditis spiculigera]
MGARACCGYLRNINLRQELQAIIGRLQKELNAANQTINDAKRTARYWARPLDENTLPLLRVAGRKLVLQMDVGKEITKINTILPKALLPQKYQHVLIFNDAMILLSKKDYRMLPLELLWLHNDTTSGPPSTGLLAPEMQLHVEFRDDVHRNKFTAACEQWSAKKPAPQKRRCRYDFIGSSTDLAGSSYDGVWWGGKPHGRGILRTADGTTFEGHFQEGKFHGFGQLTVPHFTEEKDSSFSSFFLGSPVTKTEKLTESKGVFRKGKLCGLARIRYPHGDLYEGYCINGEPHGFGMHTWDRGQYLGGWKDGKRHGYGVHTTRKTRYLGEWQDDKLHGRGCRITIDGTYHEGNWQEDMITSGCLVGPANQNNFSVEYEGNFEDYGILSGKGTLRLAPNATIHGTFSGNVLNDEVQIVDGRVTMNENMDLIERFLEEECLRESTHVPSTSERWSQMFEIFVEDELGGNFTETAIVWQKIVSGIRKGKEMSGQMRDTGPCALPVLEQIPCYDAPWTPGYRVMLHEYFNAAMNYEPHPLWRLCHGTVDLFTCSYNNMATHAALYSQATLELKSLIEENYKIIRLLFPSLPKDPYEVMPESMSKRSASVDSATSPEGSPARTGPDPAPPIEVPTPACEFLYAFLFPRVSPIIFTIYSLSSAELDAIYWNRALYLNAHTDVKLLEYFQVPRELWPIELPSVGDLDKPLIRACARRKFYESAILALQQLSTDANPTTKLAILADTFEEITQCVFKFADAGCNHTWSADDLLPVLSYVVVRSQIKHLGSEIRLLDHFTKEYRHRRSIDLMFTMLKSAYVQIHIDKWTP